MSYPTCKHGWNDPNFDCAECQRELNEVPFDRIKELERERDEARKERDDLRDSIDAMRNVTRADNEAHVARCYAAEKERDELRAEIERLKTTVETLASHLKSCSASRNAHAINFRKSEVKRIEAEREVERSMGLARFEINGAFSYLPNELVIQHPDPFAAMALTFAKLNNEIAKLRADAAMKGDAK